jgi:hypothetical protein
MYTYTHNSYGEQKTVPYTGVKCKCKNQMQRVYCNLKGRTPRRREIVLHLPGLSYHLLVQNSHEARQCGPGSVSPHSSVPPQYGVSLRVGEGFFFLEGIWRLEDLGRGKLIEGTYSKS